MADIQKKVLHAPNLPAAIQGDGRYLLHALRSILTEQAVQINAANSFTADDVDADKEGKILSPRNFRLTFSRLGGLLQWDHSLDAKNLNYYEVRTNKNVGSKKGLLERTTLTESKILPSSYIGNIFLFAISKKGQVSNPTEIQYTKTRPPSPRDVAMTKTQEGTLITFLEIPLNCIGAHIYVNDTLYESIDNIFLYTGEAVINRVRVAYYDQFGDGAFDTVYCVIPDVENFLVERNGSHLDFYWDPLPIYNVRYEVKVGATPDWDKALTIFTTKLNKHRYVYPNTGRYYMMVKAIDEHNNYSTNAAYFLLTNEPDIHKNVIIRLDQEKVGYHGNKIDLYYDKAREALLLEKDAIRGEYLIDVTLQQKYRARNWLEASVVGELDDTLVWDDLDFEWDSEDAWDTMWNGTVGDLKGVEVVHEIARHDPRDVERFFAVIPFDGNLDARGATISNSAGVTFTPSRWMQGICLSSNLSLEYQLDNPPRLFSMMFWIRLRNGLPSTRFLKIGSSRHLYLQYDANTDMFQLIGDDDATIQTHVPFKPNDSVAVGIVQDASMRRLFLYSLAKGEYAEESAPAPPIDKIEHFLLGGNMSEGKQASEASLSGVMIGAELTHEEFKKRLLQPCGYTVLMPFRVGEYEYEKALVRVSMTAGSLGAMPQIYKMAMNVDIDDTVDRGTARIEAQETVVEYNKRYYTKPEITVTLLSGNTSDGAVTPELRAIGTESFICVLRKSGGSLAAGMISWTAVGY
jgi:hypothetical protein|nr:MAG TPA: hypothetical protein [Caudoviricetes sp.]